MNALRIHPEVAGDLADAEDWYREIDPELAESFLEETYRAITLARDDPWRFSTVYKDFRRVLCERFPYKVVFQIVEKGTSVEILAVTHTSRHPDHWKHRG